QSFQPDFPGSLNHQDLMRVSQQLSALAIQQDDRLNALSIQGLDIIHGQGFFLRPTKTQKTVVEVENRSLRSQFYLLTVPTEPLLNRETLFRGNSYGILGSNSEALTWAYFLAKLGKSVTIITPNLNIFPQEDLEIIQLLRAYLEGLNIRFLTSVDPHYFAVKFDQVLDCRRPPLPTDWGLEH
ncbi:MAG: NAD-binding protein, partial [Microcystaceae cyanobacterium]